jgi:hypothetical protein
LAIILIAVNILLTYITLIMTTFKKERRSRFKEDFSEGNAYLQHLEREEKIAAQREASRGAQEQGSQRSDEDTRQRPVDAAELQRCLEDVQRRTRPERELETAKKRYHVKEVPEGQGDGMTVDG